jgi:hypothetical protein
MGAETKQTPRHTPGPWELKPVHGGVPGRRAIYACNALGEKFICAEPYDEANARLIAAAPDLLEACKLALAAFENNWAIDWNVLERAINRAEGDRS